MDKFLLLEGLRGRYLDYYAKIIDTPILGNWDCILWNYSSNIDSHVIKSLIFSPYPKVDCHRGLWFKVYALNFALYY